MDELVNTSIPFVDFLLFDKRFNMGESYDCFEYLKLFQLCYFYYITKKIVPNQKKYYLFNVIFIYSKQS